MLRLFKTIWLFILGIFSHTSTNTSIRETKEINVKRNRLAKAMKNAGKSYATTKGFTYAKVHSN